VTVAADFLLGLALVAALIDWWGVARHRVSVEFIAKPLVDIALIGTALAIDTPQDVTRGLIVAALGAALVGDVVLSTPDARFEAGILATVVSHVLFAASLVEEVELATAVVAVLLYVGIGIGAAPQIIDGARRQHPAIGVLVAGALFTAGLLGIFAAGTGVLVAAIGGGFFFASTALVTWNRFVAPAPGGNALVHATDHLGQVGLVLWLAT
jgi:hypothetical protein